MAARSISLDEARALGLKRYSTGKPCKNGHISERVVSNKTCVECLYERARAKYAEDPSKVKERAIEWSRSNPERNRARSAAWQKNNQDRISERWRRQYANDPEFRCRSILRSMVSRVIKLTKRGKTSKTFDALGYSAGDFMAHIERQFLQGMAWENHGEWHVDHISSVAELTASGVFDPAVINCLSNLRPIWASDNLRKGATQTYLL
jgi:hypothetical protein